MAEPRAVFAAACSSTIGFGHLRRCLTLAQELEGRRWKCIFWVAEKSVGTRLANEAGFETILSPEPPATDVLVVDDYAVTAERIAAWRQDVPCLVLVDDLADRALDCDIVINGSAGADRCWYQETGDAELLLGPRYALLRKEFRHRGFREIGPVRRVLVSLGGADPLGRTAAIVREVRSGLGDVCVDVVMGPMCGDAPRLESANTSFHVAPAEMAPLMMAADLGVTAGGQTTYELAACGLPAVVVPVADNQKRSIAALAAIPTLVPVPDISAVADAVVRLAGDVGWRRRLSEGGRGLVDGLGTARVADALDWFRERGRRHA